MSYLNPSCYLPSALSSYLPSLIACPPPPSYATSVYNTLTAPLSSTYSTISALASVPFLSYLIFPLFGSWSTSLNLLFFYLTWTTLVLSHGPLRVELVSTLAVRTIFYIFPSALFFAFDALLPSAALSFKAEGPAALPLGHHASRKKTLRYLRFLGWSVTNVFISTLAQTAIVVALKAIYPSSPLALNVSITLPAPFSIFKDLVKGYLAREALTYTLHRYLCHSDSTLPLPSYLTARHESWYHTLPAPLPLSASYDHPAAYLTRSFLPQILPALWFRFHLLTYLVYLVVISLEETFAYSGYSTVPTNFILGGIARRTDAHVSCGGTGNFGAWGLLDWIAGTSVGGDLLDDIEDEADKHDVGPRVQRRVEAAKMKGRRVLEDVRRRPSNEDEAYRPEKEKVPRRRKAAA